MKAGWKQHAIGDICEIVNGGTPKTGVQAYWGGEHCWITPAEMGKRGSPYVDSTARTLTDAGLESANLLPPNSIILSSRAPIGHLAINIVPMATNQGCKGLVPSKEVDSKFLYYYLGSVVELLNDLGTGATFKELSGGKLKEVLVPLPQLPEQQRIAGILDEALAGIATAKANAEKNLKNARALFASHLQSVFNQRGNGWVTRPLAECLQLITYGFTNPMPTTAEGPYMITAKNVVGGRIDYVSTRRTSQTAFDNLLTDKSRPHVGDVLLTKDGTLGRVAVVDRPGACINQSVALLRPNGRMNPQFMCALLSSSHYQQRMVDDAGGTTIKHIYITRVDKMPVAFPESVEEQERMVASLDSVATETQRLESIYQRKVTALDALKQSLLHQAFSGQL